MNGEDVPCMLRVADLGDGVNQGILPVRLEYNMEVNSGASGWVAQSFPVYWNGMPGVLDLHSSQGTTSAARSVRSTVARKEITESQKCCMSRGGQPGLCGFEGWRSRREATEC